MPPRRALDQSAAVIAGVAATRSASFGGPLGGEAPSRCQPDAAVAPGDRDRSRLRRLTYALRSIRPKRATSCLATAT